MTQGSLELVYRSGVIEFSSIDLKWSLIVLKLFKYQ